LRRWFRRKISRVYGKMPEEKGSLKISYI